MRKIIVLLMILFAQVALADNCDKPRDDFDGLYCLNKVYIEADAELNKAYKDLSGRLSEADRKRLKVGQLEWINQRNANCSYHDDQGFWVNLGCTKATTVNRTHVLNDRIRECKATGCQPSKL